MVVVEGNDDTKKMEGLCLFHTAPSYASQKVRIILEAKKLKWESQIAGREIMESDWYFAIHPEGLVPALVHDGVTHIESADILVYLDETFPEIPLRPNTEEGKQAVQAWMDLERTVEQPMKYLTYRFVVGYFAKFMASEKRLALLKEKNPEGYAFHMMLQKGSWNDDDLHGAIEKVHDVLQKLEAHLANHEWLVGDRISLADYCWGPGVYRCVEQHLYGFPMSRYPAVVAWYKRLLKDEAFQKAVVGFRGGPPKAVLAIKSNIQEFLGNNVRCFEKEVQPNWFPFVVVTAAVLVCFALLPSITAATGFSSTVINLGLAVVWAVVLRSCYKKAHAATKTAYFSSVHRMRALLTKAYGSDTPIVCEEHARPKVVLPDDILVRVKATSINPIDIRIREGYAKVGLNALRRRIKMPAGDGRELPMIQGKDCSGVVEAVGEAVSKVKVGDEVWAASEFIRFAVPGTFAEYVVLKDGYVTQKPSSLSDAQTAALAYVAMTTWGALVKTAGLGPETTAGKRVLILAGTGGIGSFAIQLVKAWGGHVTSSCSTSGREMVEELGADEVVDYTKTDLESALKDKPRFDVVLDTLGPTYYQACLNLTKQGGCVVTIVSPALLNLDKYGLLLGVPKVAYDLFRISIPQKLFYGRRFKYGFVAPSVEALDVITSLVEQKKIKPIVEKVYNMEDVNEALEHVQKGHARGKTVLVMQPE